MLSADARGAPLRDGVFCMLYYSRFDWALANSFSIRFSLSKQGRALRIVRENYK